MDGQRPTRRSVYDNLNAADKASVDKGCLVGGRVIAVVIAVCILGVCRLAAHVWHWPFWLDYTLGPVLGGAVALLAIFTLVYALAAMASRSHRARAPKEGPEPPGAGPKPPSA